MLRCLPTSSVLVRVCSLLGLSALMLGLSRPAAAQEVDSLGAYRASDSTANNPSERYFALELRFGPYLPRVDSEFEEGVHPFRDYFGTKHRFMIGAEFDWLPLTVENLLRFGVGAGLSYTAMSAPAHETESGDNSGQDTRFRVLPHWLVGVFKLDVLQRKTPVPVVFTGKFGLGNALWWVKDAPSSNSASGVKGRGQSYGLYYGLGVAVDLSALDRYRTKRLDVTTGINAIYFFGELYGLELESFGKRNAMHVGDRSWVLGLAFDF